MEFFKRSPAAMSFRGNLVKARRARWQQKKSRLWGQQIFLFIPVFIFLTAIAPASAQELQKDSLLVGSLAPTFFLKTLNGEEFYLSNYCGKLREPHQNKKPAVVILSFFATWCEPCLQEIAVLEEIAAKYAHQGLRIFLIDVNEKPEIVTAFVEKHKIQFPILLDRYGLVASKYGADKLPRYILINKDGKIMLLGKGYTAAFKENLSRALSLLLGHLAPSEVRLAQ